VSTGTFAADVRRDLAHTPKQLQSKYLYDALGSSLFDAICQLPWYRITRSECALLAAHAPTIVDAVAAGNGTIVEMGCGNGEKLRVLAEAVRARGAAAHVHLIDVSALALEQTAHRLARLGFASVAHQTSYEEGLRAALAARTAGAPVLVLFLGSNIGNFDTPVAAAFLARVRAMLAPGDRLLLGADLVKPERDLILAYDDPLGVTAAFNRNLLVRINQELGGDFDLSSFVHRALWNPADQRVEMHLVSTRAQDVRIEAAAMTVHFEAGETIWTESSYKYEPDQVGQMGLDAGFTIEAQWTDRDARFALTSLGVRS